MLWLIVAGGMLVIYWVPWAISKLGINVGEWGTTPVVVGRAGGRAARRVAPAAAPARRRAADVLRARLAAVGRQARRGAAQLLRRLPRADLGRRRLPHARSTARRCTAPSASGTTRASRSTIRRPPPTTTRTARWRSTIAKVRERLGDSEGPLRRHRARRRLAGLPFQGGRGLALLRDRSRSSSASPATRATSPSCRTASPSPTSCSAMRA